MADDEVLRRIDAHMARGNEITQRGNEIMRRSNEVMRRSNEVIEENRRAFQDIRTSLRQITLRHERVLGELADRIAEGTRELREHRGEFVEEMRAQRAALFRLLDRLDSGGEAAGA